MSPSRSRFVTACQQLLALAVVLAVLTPAASIVTLDVVGSGPAGATARWPTRARVRRRTPPRRSARRKVPTAPVKPDVREVQLTSAVAGAGRAVPTTAAAASWPRRDGVSRLTTTPQKVTGFGEVGVTWAHGVTIPTGAIAVAVRTRTHGTWTGWRTIPYDPEHGPDPGSAEARHARPGTEPMLVGTVGRVQVRAVSKRPLPGGHEARGHRPGPRGVTRRPSAPRSTPAPWTATTAPTPSSALWTRSRSPATRPSSPPPSSRRAR